MKKYILLNLCMLFLLFSCQQKEQVISTPDLKVSGQPIFKYSKSIIVFDQQKANSIVLQISTNDQQALSEFTDNDFEIIPLYQEAVEDKEYSTNTAQEKKESEQDDVVPTTSIIVIEQKLKDGVKGYEIISKKVDNNLTADCTCATSAIIGNSSAHRMVIKNEPPITMYPCSESVLIKIYYSPWGVNKWTYNSTYNSLGAGQSKTFKNCNGGIAATKRVCGWRQCTITMYVSCN